MDDEIIDWKALFGAFEKDVDAGRDRANATLASCRACLAALQAYPFADAVPFDQRLQALEQQVAAVQGGDDEALLAASAAEAAATELDRDIQDAVQTAMALQARLTTYRQNLADAESRRKLLTAGTNEETAIRTEIGRLGALGFDQPKALNTVDAELQQAETDLQTLDGQINLQIPLDLAFHQQMAQMMLAGRVAYVDSIGNALVKAIFTAEADALDTERQNALLIVDARQQAETLLDIYTTRYAALQQTATDREQQFMGTEAQLDNKVAAVRSSLSDLPILKEALVPFEARAEVLKQQGRTAKAAATWQNYEQSLAAATQALDALAADGKRLNQKIVNLGTNLRSLNNTLENNRELRFIVSPFYDVPKRRDAAVTEAAGAIQRDAYDKTAGHVDACRVKIKALLAEAEKDRADAESIETLTGRLGTLVQEAGNRIANLQDANIAAAMQRNLDIIDQDRQAALAENDVKTRKARILELIRQATNTLSKIHEQLLAGNDQALAALRRDAVTMGGTSRSPLHDAVYAAAIQVRFGVSLDVEPTAETKFLPLLYDVCCKAPASHMQNKSLTKLQYGKEITKANYFSPSEKLIAFNDMPHTPTAYQPDQGQKVSVDYFSSTTLHEIGHAVDDALGFMDGKKDDPAFGGWKEDETLDSVAKAHGDDGFFAAFDNGNDERKRALTALLKECLQGKTPSNTNADYAAFTGVWAQIKAHKSYKSCLQLGLANEPWNKGQALANQVKVGGRVYHESYAGQWSSYAFTARATTGVSAYQWRAAGEWFAEIYALYYLDELDKTKGIGKMIATLPDPQARP